MIAFGLMNVAGSFTSCYLTTGIKYKYENYTIEKLFATFYPYYSISIAKFSHYEVKFVD